MKNEPEDLKDCDDFDHYISLALIVELRGTDIWQFG